MGAGGIAPLNHRLQAGIPSGWRGGAASARDSEDIGSRADASRDAGGIGACSRWLSEATPPEDESRNEVTPAGVAALSRFVALDAESAEVLESIKALLN